MKILIITQVFYPDSVSVAQHLSDFAFYLGDQQHQIDVITSKYAYDEKNTIYPTSEKIHNVNIKRVRQTKLGKKSNIFRLIDFSSFYFSLCCKILFTKTKKYDVIFCTSAPPLISFFCYLGSHLNQKPMFYWVMDLQPELAIQSGLIKKGSFVEKFVSYISNKSIEHAAKIFTLDNYMKEILCKRGANPNRVFVAPVWPVVTDQYVGHHLDNPFRKKNNFNNKIVIMYSGNHSVVHPLTTLLDTAKLLRDNTNFLFVFIGEGVRKKEVTYFKNNEKLDNILQLPYQPRGNIHFSLSAADLQVVIMGNEFVGLTHPNKIYGALFVGRPILYIGPYQSHATDILNQLSGNILVDHNDSEKLKNHLLHFANLALDERLSIGINNYQFCQKFYNPDLLINNFYKKFID